MTQRGDDYLERLAMSEVTTFNWTIDADLAGYARHGFPGVEVWLNKVARNGAHYDLMPTGELSDDVIDALVAALDGSGLNAASVVCAGALTEPDDEAWNAGSTTSASRFESRHESARRVCSSARAISSE